MILIADSGSTKCDWTIIDAEGTTYGSFNTVGINPYFHDEKFVEDALLSVNGEAGLFDKIEYVFFYGAGASSFELCAKVERGLNRVFPNANVEVDHDLIGAAYATYDGRSGITCILGTGSNSCYFDGVRVREEVPSLAYILGDEASGSYFGKILLREYFYRKLPMEINEAFEKEFGLTYSDIVDKVYKQSGANVYLASFMKFVGKWSEHPHVINWVVKGLEEFIDIHVVCFPEHKNVPIHFVGSIGHYFRHCVEEAISNRGLHMGNVVRKPIEGLVNYHVTYKIPQLSK